MGDELRGMVMTFRVSELQMLLGYASQNKTGRKSELQARALSLLKNKSVPHLTQIHAKIRELYKTIQQGAASGDISAASILPSQPCTQRSSGTPTAPMIAPPPQSASAPPIPVSTPLPSTNQQPLSNSFMSLTNRQTMYGSMYGYQQPKMPAVTPVTPYPQQVVHPDVRIKSLPFYDLLSELIKPSSLAGCLTNNPSARGHESSFAFYLTPQQATEVASNREIGPGFKNEFSVQVQLRFCLLETSCEQEDIFPPGISVKVNGKPATLPNPIPTNRPGQEPKRPPRPVNISGLVKLCPFVANHIVVSWSPDYSRGYVLVVHLVRKLSAYDLLNRLKTKGVKNADYTTGLIKEKLCETDTDCEIATTSLRVSLLCPLGKMKMGIPARSMICSHLQCFDASLYLQMNEKRPTWTCPVCDKQIPFDTIAIDGYFQDVLNSPSLPSDLHEVQLLKDGSWCCPVIAKEEAKPTNSVVMSPKADIEEILDDGDDEVSAVAAPKEEKEKKMIEIDLTVSDSDDDAPIKSSTQPAAASTSNSNNTLQNTKRTTDLTASDGSNSSVGALTRTMESSIIMLDSPSPPPSPIAPSPLPPTTLHLPYHTPTTTPPIRSSHMYPQIIQGAGQNINRPLVMQIRMPPPADHGRYHPY